MKQQNYIAIFSIKILNTLEIKFTFIASLFI